MRKVTPRANCCRRTPSCPNRSLSAISGKVARARRLRMPQRLSVSKIRTRSKSASKNSTSTGRLPNCSASFPSAITVTPENPRAAINAVSGFAATATLVSSPKSEARCDTSRAIFGRGPKSDSMPARSRMMVSQPASSTRGENACAQSSNAA